MFNICIYTYICMCVQFPLMKVKDVSLSNTVCMIKSKMFNNKPENYGNFCLCHTEFLL